MEVGSQQWQPDSWCRYPATHQPLYRDNQRLRDISQIIANYPPLIPFTEIRHLQSQLLEVVAGRSFILQGGGCAELFTDCRADKITAEIALLELMAERIAEHSGQLIVKIGRIAGQYAKARSQNFEVIDGHEVVTFRGDNINSRHPRQRTTDPLRLQQGYLHAAATMNFIRSQQRRPFYISHEGLVLTYEQAMTRKVAGRYYNGGAHLLWIGDRTRDATQAHVEYCRGIANPIAIKLGPSAQVSEVLATLHLLNPTNELAKIMLICRFGVEAVFRCLPKFIETINDQQLNVIWSVDPMHGNTRRLGPSMIKTRLFSDIAQELTDTITIHRRYNSRLQGVHLELTSEPVTECLGGPQQLTEKNLTDNYRTACDPRLNYQQSLEIADQLAAALSY